MPLVLPSAVLNKRSTGQWNRFLDQLQLDKDTSHPVSEEFLELILEAIENESEPLLDDVCDVRVKPTLCLDDNLLYVSQREFAALDTSSNDGIKYIGSDSATTCHLVLLVHRATKVVGLAHFDGCGTSQGVSDLLKLMNMRVDVVSNATATDKKHRYELYLYGGFKDDRKHSIKLSRELLNVMLKQPETLELKALCVGLANSRLVNGTYYPTIYGIVVQCDTLEISMLECESKGPDSYIKGCRNFVGPKQMVQAYDNQSGELVIQAFDYTPIPRVDLWLLQTDEFMLKNLSTSPDQEPADFVKHVRQSLECMLKHPKPLQTLFIDGKDKRYKLVAGHWYLI